MIGVVLVAQGSSAQALLHSAEGLVGPLPRVVALSAGDPSALEAAASSLDDGTGLLFLVDLVGSSQARQSLEQARLHQGAVLAGLSLAMLLKLATTPRTTAEELAHALAATAHKAIEVLR